MKILQLISVLIFVTHSKQRQFRILKINVCESSNVKKAEVFCDPKSEGTEVYNTRIIMHGNYSNIWVDRDDIIIANNVFLIRCYVISRFPSELNSNSVTNSVTSSFQLNSTFAASYPNLAWAWWWSFSLKPSESPAKFPSDPAHSQARSISSMPAQVRHGAISWFPESTIMKFISNSLTTTSPSDKASHRRPTKRLYEWTVLSPWQHHFNSYWMKLQKIS